MAKGKNKERRQEKGKTKRGIWDEREKEEFKEKLGRIEGGEKEIQEEIEEIGKRIRESMKECEGKKDIEKGSRRG